MEKLTVLPLDLKRSISSNFQKETQTIHDSNCPYFKPNYSPFFTEGMEVLDGEGGLLKLNKDYRLVGLCHPLVKKTGKEVKLYVEILNPEVLLQKTIQFSYHSLGNTKFPVGLLKEMVDELTNTERWIDWETELVGKPTQFSTVQHYHDVATEVANWDNFIGLAQQRLNWLYNVKQQFDQLQGNIRSEADEFDDNVAQFKTDFYQHEQDYHNPHHLTRHELGVQHIMNAPLATAEEELSFKPNRFTTPLGLQQVIQKRSDHVPAYLKGGVLNELAYDKTYPLTLVRSRKVDLPTEGQHGAFVQFNSTDFIGEWVSNGSTLTLQTFNGELNRATSVTVTDSGYDMISQSLSNGVLIGDSLGNHPLRFYPRLNHLHDEPDHYATINDAVLKDQFGLRWIEQAWVISAKEGLFVWVLGEDHEGTFPELTLWYTPADFIDPDNELTLTNIDFTYTDFNGQVIPEPVKGFKGFHYRKNVRNELTVYHHDLEWTGSEVTPMTSYVLAGETLSDDETVVLMKLLTGFTFPDSDQIIPIEVSWEFNLADRKLTLLPGNNITTLDPLDLPDLSNVVTELLPLLTQQTLTKKDQYEWVFKTTDLSYRVIQLEAYGQHVLHYYPLAQCVKRVTDPVSITDDTSTFPDLAMGVIVPNPIPFYYHGTLDYLLPTFYNLNHHSDYPANQTFYHYVGYEKGKLTSWFSLTPVTNQELIPVSVITTDETKVSSVVLV